MEPPFTFCTSPLKGELESHLTASAFPPSLTQVLRSVLAAGRKGASSAATTLIAALIQVWGVNAGVGLVRSDCVS